MIMIVGFLFAFVLLGIVGYIVYEVFLALLNVDMEQDSDEDIIFGL